MNNETLRYYIRQIKEKTGYHQITVVYDESIREYEIQIGSYRYYGMTQREALESLYEDLIGEEMK